jgi:hypothetical protein
MNTNDLKEDVLSQDEWSDLKEIKLILESFQEVIKWLEGNIKDAHYGLIWEALPIVELLLIYLEELKKVYRTGYIAISINFT